ncbi:MAG TPA: DinB family protein [Anaerolineae bacterium]|nr:DinB family protein [Anaerolineae bacterium]HQI85287.1 DinB family protein [Anaerolineae bacterium]
MNFEYLKRLMAQQAEIIHQLTEVTPEQARWKPDTDTWSLLEIINHLYDEEREDFRAHLDAILHRPEDPWSPIRPFEWVTERAYNARDLETSIQNFLAERRASLAWLESLGTPDWEASIPAPWGGVMRAGDMFASWVIHDQWHIQQLVQIRRAYTIAQAAPYDVRYAGTL